MSVSVIVGAVVAAVVVYLLVTGAVVEVARRRLGTSWAGMRAAVSERAAVASRLAGTVATYAGGDPVVAGLAEAAQASRAAAGVAAERRQAEQSLVTALRAVTSLAREYPELRGDPVHQDLQDQLERVQSRVDTAAGAYRRAAQRLDQRRASRVLRPAAVLLRCPAATPFDPGTPFDPPSGG